MEASDDGTRLVPDEMVEALARLAELELDAERRPVVAETFEGLIRDAQEVNRFMAGRRDAGIAVRFDRPELRGGDAA
jgi:Asp-tRNA(Asn)/Glu-tRNA(Gln) amidotransferase C subunit